MTDLKEIAKRPTTIAITVLSVVCFILIVLLVQKADTVLTKDKEILQVHDQMAIMTASTVLQKDSVRKLTEELTATKSELTTASNSLSWYVKNWHKTTTVTKDPGGKEVTVIDEGSNETGGASSSSSSVTSSASSTKRTTDSSAVTTIYKHDTTNTVVVHDSLVYRDHEVLVEYTKKGRVYAGVGGAAGLDAGKLSLAPEIRAGFTYGFTKLTYLGFEVDKSGVLDYSQGYKVGAFVGGKLDF